MTLLDIRTCSCGRRYTKLVFSLGWLVQSVVCYTENNDYKIVCYWILHYNDSTKRGIFRHYGN